MPEINKIKSYEFFTPAYSVIIQGKNFSDAMDQFSQRYRKRGEIIMVIDCDFFRIINKHIVEQKIK